MRRPVPTDATGADGLRPDRRRDHRRKLSLETRYKDNGAVVGTHTVVFVYDDRDNLGKYQENLREAKQDGDQASMDAAQKNIDNYKAVKKTRPRAPYDNYSEKFEVPLGGTAEANFQLPE